MSILLVTFLNCNQVLAISYRLQGIAMLSPKQKYEILVELRKVVPTCPVIINENEQYRKRI
jgi:hypothetical protein